MPWIGKLLRVVRGMRLSLFGAMELSSEVSTDGLPSAVSHGTQLRTELFGRRTNDHGRQQSLLLHELHDASLQSIRPNGHGAESDGDEHVRETSESGAL